VQWDPMVRGPWAVWRTGTAETRSLGYRNLLDGRNGTITTGDYLVEGSYDVTGGQVFAIESAADGRKALASYTLPAGTRRLIGQPRGDAENFRGQLRASGPAVVWAEGVWGALDIRGYDLDRNQEFVVSAAPGQQEFPAVGGGVVAWRDRRDAPDPYGAEAHIYAYDLARRQETRLTRKAEAVSPPQVSDGAVAWLATRDNGVYVVVYDLPKQIERVVAGPFQEASGLSLDGKLLVWSAAGPYDTDLYGY
ncbi:MAG: hypothetical protein NTZ05_14390, partial [Chloroflexi bacterium]|nr:hypothetical protein [Chloroflexota bacterium]